MPGNNILIIDDEASIRVMLMRMIEPLGHSLFLAVNGREAYEMMKERDFDLIISDLLMPQMGGLEFLETIRKDGNDSAFIILTGYGDLPQALSARDQFNISNFLVKPIHNMDQFLFDVESAISRRRLERENRSLMKSLQEMNTALEAKVEERTRELREKNSELAQLSNFRADVLQVLGHELRTPLAILSGYHHLSSQSPSEIQHQINSLMGNSIHKLEEKIERALLLLKGTERTQFPLEPRPVSPSRLFEEICQGLSPFLLERGIQFRMKESTNHEECTWDRDKIWEVIEEVLINAVRASRNDSQIELSILGEGLEVEFRIKDHGIGIPEDQRERIFEPFVTLGKADHHSSGLFDFGAEGIGIGLSTAKMWIDLHRGSIAAEPNRDSPGTTFLIRLPRHVTVAGVPGGLRPGAGDGRG